MKVQQLSKHLMIKILILVTLSLGLIFGTAKVYSQSTSPSLEKEGSYRPATDATGVPLRGYIEIDGSIYRVFDERAEKSIIKRLTEADLQRQRADELEAQLELAQRMSRLQEATLRVCEANLTIQSPHQGRSWYQEPIVGFVSGFLLATGGYSIWWLSSKDLRRD